MAYFSSSLSSLIFLSLIIEMIPLYAVSSANCPICLPLPLIVPVLANETFTRIPFSSIWLTSSLPPALIIVLPINDNILIFYTSSSTLLLWQFAQKTCNKLYMHAHTQTHTHTGAVIL